MTLVFLGSSGHRVLDLQGRLPPEDL